MGDSIPRAFSKGAGKVFVGIALVLDDRILSEDVFDLAKVDYFAIGEIEQFNSS